MKRNVLIIFLTMIVFSQPVKFSEAAERRAIQSILPTNLSSAELSRIPADILERAFFSARESNAEVLQRLFTVIGEYVNGNLDLASARLEIKKIQAAIGYAPSGEDAGTLRDRASDERINLQIRMNAQSAAGYGYWLQSQSHLLQWPCQELLRVGYRRTHRQWSGEDDSAEIIKGEPVIGRWREQGGQLYGENRMIALVNAPIWSAINRFEVPYPPFDFNSGMGVAGVNRQNALSLGVITKDAPVQAAETRDFNQDLKYSTSIRAAALRQALEDFGYTFEGDVLTP